MKLDRGISINFFYMWIKCNFRLGVLLMIFSISAKMVIAQEKNQIDADYEKFVAAHPSTAGMMAAMRGAQVKWEKEIESNLKSLEAKLQPDEWRLLEMAQKNWLIYRDSEIKVISSLHKSDNSESKLESSMQMMKLAKERALMLQEYMLTASD